MCPVPIITKPFDLAWIEEPDGTVRPAASPEEAEMALRKTRTVASDTVGEIWISTVFLVFDHGFFAGGPPLIYETALFTPTGVRIWERYSTRQEAAEGHQMALNEVRAGR